MTQFPLKNNAGMLLSAFLGSLLIPLLSMAVEIPAGEAGHRAHIKPFFETYCIQCHGPDKSKGRITLHTLDGNLAAGADGELRNWEKILEVLEYKEMPPDDEKNLFDANSELEYNTIAVRVMAKHKIPVLDLHSHVMAQFKADDKHPPYDKYPAEMQKRGHPIHTPLVRALSPVAHTK